MPRPRLGFLVTAYFFGREFERAIVLSDQIPEESQGKFSRFFGLQVMRFSVVARMRSAPKLTSSRRTANRCSKYGSTPGEVFARTNEQELEREGFGKLGLRICGTEEELKKFDNPKRLPEMHQNVSSLDNASFYDRLLLLAARKKAINSSTAAGH